MNSPQQGGLFEDIAEGLKVAKVMIACVSDEVMSSCVIYRFCFPFLLKRYYLHINREM